MAWDAAESLECFALLRNQGWVGAAALVAQEWGGINPRDLEPAIFNEMQENLRWLHQAIHFERKNGRYSLLRDDDPDVRRRMRLLARFARRGGLPRPQFLDRAAHRGGIKEVSAEWVERLGDRLWRLRQACLGRFRTKRLPTERA